MEFKGKGVFSGFLFAATQVVHVISMVLLVFKRLCDYTVPSGRSDKAIPFSASRKRQINSDKSHSGGSDADDESAQPAKQPNRKRLSTVSFASSPFVRESPADLTQSKSSRRSPLASLSFVSKDSSHHLSDNSFTPGSGRTGRASVGSASGVSSAHSAESDIDPEEEVTLTNDDKQQEGKLKLL